MAPTAYTVEWQTREIIKYLLEDDEDAANRHACLQTDGVTESNDGNFDPVAIADTLRSVADSLNDDVKFRAALSDLKRAAAQEAAEAAFRKGVEALCQTQVLQRAEVASEMQLIKASVALGIYVKKSCPELKNTVQHAMTSFLNRHVGAWVTQQGGWDKVKV